MVLDLDALHILSADIQDTVDLRVEEGSGVVVGDGLDLSLIQHKGSLHQRFAVSGGTGPCDVRVLREQGIDLLDRRDHSLQRIAVVVGVEGIEQFTVLRHESCLGGRGAGIDPEEAVAGIGLQISRLYIVLFLAADEFIIFLPGGKERIHAGHFEFDLDPVPEHMDELRHRSCAFAFSIESGSDRGEQMRVLRYDRMLVIELQRADECLSQLAEEMKRSSQERDVAADGTSAGKT